MMKRLAALFRSAPRPSVSMQASGVVSTPEIPLPSNNPDWNLLASANTKEDLARLDSELSRRCYSVDGSLRKALRLKYETIQ